MDENYHSPMGVRKHAKKKKTERKRDRGHGMKKGRGVNGFKRGGDRSHQKDARRVR